MAASLIRKRPGAILCPLKFNTNRLKLKQVVFCATRRRPSHCLSQCSASTLRYLSTTSTIYSTDQSPSATNKSSIQSQTSATAARHELKQEAEESDNTVYRERYIPVTRQSIIRYLVQEKDLLSEEERKLLPGFVRALDAALVSKYQHVLEELKILFDPINPDKDTLKSREWTRKEKQENEFWLLQNLEEVMVKANFHELPKQKIEKFLKAHESQDKVQVTVDPSKYDVLRFWVLGHDIPEFHLSLIQRVFNRIFQRSPRKPVEYFKRVVVALRLKKDSKLILKAFKEVPINSLEMLLPDGTIRMRAVDRVILTSTAAIAGFGIVAKMVTVLASVQVDWTLVLTLVTGTLGFRVWSSYRNRRNAYLVAVSRILYFKNIANNQGLLTLLVDRAEDESLKEALLTYIFLLKPNIDRIKSQSSIGLTSKELETKVEKWLKLTTGAAIEFEPREALKLLHKLGLLTDKGDRYQVLDLDTACRLLPQSPPSVISRRGPDADITGGYDKDECLETEDGYKLEDQKSRRFGWF